MIYKDKDIFNFNFFLDIILIELYNKL